LRYAELLSLKRGSFDFGNSPSVTVKAAYAKNGKTSTLFLPVDLANDLAAYVASLESDAGIVSTRRHNGPCGLTDRWKEEPLGGEMTADQGLPPSRRDSSCSTYRFAPGSSTPPPSSPVGTAP
jgi:hypothetical protein